ncbi:peptidoglycan editing factor PgeF [Arcobacter sp. LA11]|uniref:peptidoglycan editing factor PgeF n=1 Tax=Arcobacter sp. LA11 TaxID=1898176 RepID=UPI000932D99F|nr:peptidoglycan editing factor PgeF [Arcobacter sp. LA11]
MKKMFYTFTTTTDGNLAYHVPDTKENVDKNRKELATKYNFDLENLIYMNQVHGNNVEIITKDSPRLIDSCDGIITNEKNLTLMVMVADCIPILYMDKIKGVVAAVHAGRNSTFQRIAEITVQKMIEEFDCNVKDIEVILGPSIQKCCYEVNLELANIVKESFGEEFVDGRLIDLQGINKMLLNEQGISNISIYNTCTKCSNEPYFSFRKDKNCGRFAGLISVL